MTETAPVHGTHAGWFPAELFLFCLLLPIAVSCFLTYVLVRVAPHVGLMDLPSDRKVHVKATPRGGGLAVFAAIILTTVCLPLYCRCLAARDDASEQQMQSCFNQASYLSWLLTSLLVALGLADDLRPIRWQVRLGVQALLAAGAVLGCLQVATWWGRGIAVLWLLAMTNAFNMLDNMDALAAGVAFIGAACLTAAFTFSQDAHDVYKALPYLMLVGAVLGFLPFNLPTARIFMGDAGSTLLGFMIGLGTLEIASRSDQPELGWLTALCICAVPVYDQLTVVLLRISQGRSPFHADKQHLSHRLVSRGLTSQSAVRVIHLLALASGIGGVVLCFADHRLTAWVVLGVGLCVYGVLARVELVPFVRGGKQ